MKSTKVVKKSCIIDVSAGVNEKTAPLKENHYILQEVYNEK